MRSTALVSILAVLFCSAAARAAEPETTKLQAVSASPAANPNWRRDPAVARHPGSYLGGGGGYSMIHSWLAKNKDHEPLAFGPIHGWNVLLRVGDAFAEWFALGFQVAISSGRRDGASVAGFGLLLDGTFFPISGLFIRPSVGIGFGYSQGPDPWEFGYGGPVILGGCVGYELRVTRLLAIAPFVQTMWLTKNDENYDAVFLSIGLELIKWFDSPDGLTCMPRSAEDILDRAWQALEGGVLHLARAHLRRLRGDKRHLAEIEHLHGAIALDEGDSDQALVHLTKSLAIKGDNADVLYDLGLTYELRKEDKRCREAFLEVLRLDSAGPPVDRDPLSEETLIDAAEAAFAALPHEIVNKLANVPIIVEERPAQYLVEEGFDPRALGLFDGPPWSEQGLTGPQANQIVLYRANIAAVARSRAEAKEQVRITLLHELAHFFGLDEDEVAARGLA